MPQPDSASFPTSQPSSASSSVSASPALPAPRPCFALLDDIQADNARPTSRLYHQWVGEYRCEHPDTLDAVWQQVDAALAAGLHAVLLADYEWGVWLQGLPPLAGQQPKPALRILMFAQLQHLSAAQVDTWLASQTPTAPAPAPAGITDLAWSMGETDFSAALAQIHDALLAGESYQINYTLRLDFQAYGDPVNLYRRLRASQPVAYGALIALPATKTTESAAESGPEWVLSCSPELFLQHQHDRLTAKPMKGTVARNCNAQQDRHAADWLTHDAKNRAENVMIVDLLRNDLGRIARTGSVRVPQLFEVESHASVFQMTSTVTAERRADIRFPDILRALYPCGSITGAPKYRTMEWIRRLETRPRGLYTGMIGWIEATPSAAHVTSPSTASSTAPPSTPTAPAAGCGDFCLSVAIRTLTLGPAQSPPAPRPPITMRPGTMGIGAGIVLDSQAEAEYAECQLKARFLTRMDPGFQLFETLYATREHGIRHLPQHLARLQASAHALYFAWNETAIQRALTHQLATLPPSQTPGQAYRLKLLLAHSGTPTTTAALLQPLATGPVKLLLAEETTAADDLFLHHKTTHRHRYDQAIQQAEQDGAFDMLFFNAAGELTEGARSNVLLRLEGQWYTPPQVCGLLPGVMRSLLLADPNWQVHERRLSREDLFRAEAIAVCNALRGVLPAQLNNKTAICPAP